MRTQFIAELGSNHNGSLERALALVDAAGKAGFDAVKTQHWRVEVLFAEPALRFKPGLRERKDLEVPDDWHKELRQASFDRGMTYGVTITSAADYGLLRGASDFLKIASYELPRLDLIRTASRNRDPLIISTGMATWGEVLAAIHCCEAPPTLLHCISSYPTYPDDCNLSVIDNMQKRCCVPVGWSDHTSDPEVIQRAIHRWRASTIEMHLDLDDGNGVESVFGHCWRASDAAQVIEASKTMPKDVERWHTMDGHGCKDPMACELEERRWRADPFDGQRPLLEERALLARTRD